MINQIGFGLAIACCLYIFLYVKQALSYNRFSSHSDDIYQVHYHATNGMNLARVPLSLAPLMKDAFPGVKNAARIYQRNISIKILNQGSGEERNFEEDGVAFVDRELFEIFNFEWITGNKASVILDPYGVVITEDIAWKYFDNESPIGKILYFGDDMPSGQP